jgi:phosphate transport system substrate-binding protein
MRRTLFVIVILVSLALAGAGHLVLAAQPDQQVSGQVGVAGSTTVQPLAEKLAEAFTAQNPDVQIDVQGGGSSVGVKSAGQGTVNIGTVSRELAESEKKDFPDLTAYTIALDGIAPVVNPGVQVSGLTKDQLRDIFTGKIKNWKEVGGDDRLITVVSREEGSGTRTAFEELVMGKDNLIVNSAILQPSNGAIRTTISTTPDSIGYLSFGYLDNSLKALPVNGVEPTEANAANGTYPIVRPLLMITKGAPAPAALAWLNYILSPEGQKVVQAEGYLPVLPTKALTGDVSVAGSTTVQPLAEKLAESFAVFQPGVKIDIQAGGSSVGVKSAGQGMTNIGTVSRELADSEKKDYPDLQVFKIALDGIAPIVNPEVQVKGLTKDQVKDIFSGKIRNWKEVGGEDKSITVVSREEGSGTRTAFEELVMGKDNPIVDAAILQPSNGAIRTTVSTTPDSIGYMSLGYLDNTVKALPVNGVEPMQANAANGTYPIVRPLLMITKGAPGEAAKAWLDYILSSNGQHVVAAQGYVPVK